MTSLHRGIVKKSYKCLPLDPTSLWDFFGRRVCHDSCLGRGCWALGLFAQAGHGYVPDRLWETPKLGCYWQKKREKMQGQWWQWVSTAYTEICHHLIIHTGEDSPERSSKPTQRPQLHLWRLSLTSPLGGSRDENVALPLACMFQILHNAYADDIEELIRQEGSEPDEPSGTSLSKTDEKTAHTRLSLTWAALPCISTPPRSTENFLN